MLIISVLIASSVAAAVVGRTVLGLSPDRLPAAAARLFECLGLAAVFLGVNLAAATVVTIAVRTLTPGFISAYAVGDVAWIVFSVCQAITFQWWRAAAPREGLS